MSGFEEFAMTDKDGALKTIEVLLWRLGVTDVRVHFNDPKFGERYGYYDPSSNMIYLNTNERGQLPRYVVVHEFGHLLHNAMNGFGDSTYEQGEGFAIHLQRMYMSNYDFLTFRCACGNDQFHLLPDGDLQCVSCGTLHFSPIY